MALGFTSKVLDGNNLKSHLKSSHTTFIEAQKGNVQSTFHVTTSLVSIQKLSGSVNAAAAVGFNLGKKAEKISQTFVSMEEETSKSTAVDKIFPSGNLSTMKKYTLLLDKVLKTNSSNTMNTKKIAQNSLYEKISDNISPDSEIIA